MMRKGFLIVSLLFFLMIPVRADSVSLELLADCQTAIEGGLKIELGYRASADLVGTSELELSDGAGIVGDLPDTFDAGEHHDVFAVILLGDAEAHWTAEGADFMATLTIRNDMELPDCSTAEWLPDTPHILIPAPHDGLYQIEIEDAYGHWSQVTDDAHPDGIVLAAQNGFVELIGSVGQDTDPDHYRLIEVNA